MEELYVAPQAPLHNEGEIVKLKLWEQAMNVSTGTVIHRI